MIAFDKYLSRVDGMKADSTLRSETTTLRRYRKYIENHDHTPETATNYDIDDYLIHLSSEEFSPATISTDFAILRQYYRFLDNRDYIEENPFDDVEKSDYQTIMTGHNKTDNSHGDVIYVTEEEAEKIFKGAPAPSLRNELLLRILWETGIRRGEASDVLLSDIDRSENSILIDSRKVDSDRRVYYQPATDIILEQWLHQGYRNSFNTSESPYLLVTRESESIPGNTINGIVKRAAREAGVQKIMYEGRDGKERSKITAHTMRHGHAVHALKSGIDVRSVQKHMGHRNIETTLTYLQIVDKDIRDAYQQFNQVD